MTEEKDDDLSPRDYQGMLAEQALVTNKILFLPTGSGKTFISIMVLKQLFPLLEPPFLDGGKRAAFLVNTVALVEQQAAVLKRHLPVDDVGKYSGDMNLDFWSKDIWEEEFIKHQVMVMTAEILHKLLLQKYISLNKLALIILDECHHAVEDHPMRQIMRLFEDCPEREQPRVIGLTASLLNATPKSLPRIATEVKNLEITLHSTVATVDSWETVRKFSTKPRETFAIYEPYCDKLLSHVTAKIDSMIILLKNFEFVSERTFKVSHLQGFLPMFSGKKNEMPNLIVQVSKQLSMLGPYGCYKTLYAVFTSLRLIEQNMVDDKSKRMISAVDCLLFSLSRHLESIMSKTTDDFGLRALEYSSPKVHLLLQLIEEQYKRCNSGPEECRERLQVLVFVEERMTAKILCNILTNIARSPHYSFLKPGFMVGGTFNPLSETWEGSFRKHKNDAVVKRFRDGELNLIVSTDILEEGIDIAQCNMVVRFDLVKSYRSYIQSKGRARHKKSLFYLMMTQTERSEYRNRVQYFNEIELVLEKLLVGKTDDRLLPTELELEALYESEIEPYYTAIGSKVTLTSSISLVNGYCMSLAHDRFCKVTPSYHWKREKCGERITVAIQLPKLSPMQDIVKGKAMPTIKIAKRAAALETCKKLHEEGELNDYLMPSNKCLEEEDMQEILPLWREEDTSLTNEAKTGTSKRTRLYQLHKPLCFQDCYPKANHKLFLHQISIDPVYEAPSSSSRRKCFVFAALRKKQNFVLISSKPMNLVCQFPVFSKFGELKVRVRSNAKSVCLSKEEISTVKLFHWNLFHSLIPIVKNYLMFVEESFLIAPIQEDDGGDFSLDWATMNACSKCDSSKALLSCVVVPAHRGLASTAEAYLVTRICKELNSRSRFPDKLYRTYEDYYMQRHQFKINSPDQPLVEVQPLKLCSNDLLPRPISTEISHENETYFPIEACKIKCTEGCLLLKACSLPSILHRLEGLLKADELRREIAIGTGIGMIDVAFDQICSGPERSSCESQRVCTEPSKPLAVSFVKRKSSRRSNEDSSLKPWGDAEEPIDVERYFDVVSVQDIRKYQKFVNTRVKVADSVYRAKPRDNDKRGKLPPLRDGEGVIKLINDCVGSSIGPHPCHILEATTAASADDLSNLERLETLGDSFLKFAVSFFLYKRFPTLAEGKLTTVKGQVLGNRNLFYCAEAKQLGDYLKVQKMVPSQSWIPPCVSIPKDVDEITSLLKCNLYLTEEEQFSGTLKKDTIDNLRKKIPDTTELMGKRKVNPWKQEQLMGDKTIADALEALIGAYLQACGPKAAINFLVWMKVLPEKAKTMLVPFLKSQTSTAKEHILNSACNDLEGRLGYKFKNRSLLSEATTHSSSPSCQSSYERLEFIGDAVLDFLITAHMFENCGQLNPGQLTDLRSALVNNITFACLSVRYGFYKNLNSGSPALLEAIDRFVLFQEGRKHVIDEEVLILLEEKECKLAETVDVPKALGDLFEALIGAVFLDCGCNFSVVWKVIYRLMRTEICKFSKKVPKQVVRRLYEAVGQHGISFRKSDATSEMGMEQVMIVLSVRVGDEERHYNGFGVNKSQAKKSAAKLALRDLKEVVLQ